VEALVPVATIALGLVQGHVGIAEQLLGLFVVVRRQRDTDAHANRKLVALDLERWADRVDQPLRGVTGGVAAFQAGQHHGELVPTQPSQGIVLAQFAAQALAQRA